VLAVVLGALRTGVVPVVLDPGLPEGERAGLIADADPALDVGDDPGCLLGSRAADLAAAYVGTADPVELSAWARERLSPAQRPTAVHRLDDLPRTSTGKVRRLDLPGLLGSSSG
jgi:acyl-coenzyme A synthetase/AMP-(fatty) acid ligase